MRGESMKDKSKKSTYSTTFGIDPIKLLFIVEKPRHIRSYIYFSYKISKIAGNITTKNAST